MSPMSPLSSSEDRGPNLSHNLLSPRTLPASATLSLSSSAAGGLSRPPKLHTLNLGASGAGGAGGSEKGGEERGEEGGESLEWQESESLEWQHATDRDTLPAKHAHGVLQTRDAWGDFQEGGAHVIAAGSTGRIEVKEEEWGDFDEGVDEALTFPRGARPSFHLNPKPFPQLCPPLFSWLSLPLCMHPPHLPTSAVWAPSWPRGVVALLAKRNGRD